ncbi:hypothetical protein [Nonomuraea wenchangensis]|uniref:Uncharacterized protein n=1 Tax=Nonomuraea wenchangensis TaxID=568860 RepID=A0A1I0KMA9_9ACTN|nr:hypothetical protein [Nonomuraea wenchangensis]SEU26216.1 hypothetical protein SAMN05421811_108387 [Nonomuraea wenchangensis]
MNETGKVALALVAGYYLGRRHKLRMATAMAATVLFRRLKRNGGDLLSASPELGELTGRLRGELLDLTKSAAMTAAVRQIEALADRLEQAGQAEKGSEEGAEEGTDEGADENADQEGGGEEAEEEEEPRSAKSRLPKPRAPKPHVPRAADRVRAAASGVARRRSSDRDKTRE